MAESKYTGRPREYNREKIAEDLVIWAQKDSSINLNQFCALNKIAPPRIVEFANENEIFLEAYNLAKAYLGYRREEKLQEGKLHIKAYDLNAATYDYFLKNEKRDQAKFESELKIKENTSASEEDKKQNKEVIDLLKRLQNQSKE